MALLTTADYPAIRAALDVSLTARDLPDSVIGLAIYVGAAEAEVLVRDPVAASRIGAEKQHLVNAAVFLTAAYLAPALPALTKERFAEYSYEQEVDWLARAADLRRRFEAELAAVLAPNDAATYSRPTMFTTAAGTRGL